jgi:thymidylate synthase
MKDYLNLLRKILLEGQDHEDRTGVGRKSIYGEQLRFNLAKGFPLVTTKKVNFDNIAKETLWFLSGSQRSLDLEEQGVNIWKQWTPTKEDVSILLEKINDDFSSWGAHTTFDKDEFALKAGASCWDDLEDTMLDRVGTIGPLYGAVWRGKYGNSPKPDQISNLIRGLKMRPFHSRHCVTAWVPELLPHPRYSPVENVLLGKGALAPCHFFFQCFVKDAAIKGGPLRLSMNLNCRSMDAPIGTPYNIAQYAMLLMMLAQVTDMVADELIVTGGDVHIYLNQVDLVHTQLNREPYPLPQLKINPEIKRIDDFKLSDFVLVGYEYHPFIKYPVAT